ncbi:MAG: sensor histidine kinase [Bacillota bacterium]
MKISTKAYFLVIIILLQNLAILALTNRKIILLMNQVVISFDYPYIFGVLLNLMGMSAILLIYYILKFLEREKESINKLNNSKEVIDALRGQKHDFMNHLVVIGGMIQLEKSERALDYIYNVTGNVEASFSISKIGNVELAATLYRKCAIAESKGIKVELDITTSLEDLQMDSIDLCKVVFNLIDNAIYELEHCEEEEKILTIDVQSYENQYYIAIGNSYPILSPSTMEKIFQKGFSTKEGEGRGYGLSIVKKIVEQHQGKITVESYEGVGTIFTVSFPIKTYTGVNREKETITT